MSNTDCRSKHFPPKKSNVWGFFLTLFCGHRNNSYVSGIRVRREDPEAEIKGKDMAFTANNPKLWTPQETRKAKSYNKQDKNIEHPWAKQYEKENQWQMSHTEKNLLWIQRRREERWRQKMVKQVRKYIHITRHHVWVTHGLNAGVEETGLGTGEDRKTGNIIKLMNNPKGRENRRRTWTKLSKTTRDFSR